MPYPSRLGDPCWDAAQVGKVIAVNAQTSATSVDYFLAAHSPFRLISNLGGAGAELTEEDVYQDIFSLGRGEVQAAIRGEPGTGKSHLVHWLKLRADFDAKGNKRIRKFVRVLVQRGNGSLKDALQQIVAQLVDELGADFEKHLQGVQNALDQLSESTARATLLSELALEIDNRWTERNRAALAAELVPLGDFLRSAGTRRWLLRSNGTIDEVIRRLTEPSTVEQRESPPAFQAADLTPEPQFLSPRENGERVRRFCEDLEVDEEFRAAALATLNTALPDAIGEMTGLGGSNLLQIFHEIRRELADRKRELAIFIEDVSVTAAGLDRDVINALEPQERSGLCRMVAVLGMTSNAWERLAENQRGRIKPIFDVGTGVVEKWAGDADEVARFTARYLNAIRSDDRQMHRLAEARYQGDVPKSICDDCPVHDNCFAVFGHVQLDNGVDIGVFPFTPPAPQALLSRRTSASASGVTIHTQRELLGDVLQPILDDAYHSLQSREFPRSQSLRVRPIAPSSWTGFENRYLGGWDSTAKDRIRWLAQFWILAGDADELASALGPLLKPLGLPIFAAAPRAPSVKTPSAGDKTPLTSAPPPAATDPLLRARLEQIEEWRNGGNLRADGQFRELLSSLITSGIRWEDERQVPHAQFERYVNTTAFPRVEGQTSQPANQPYFLDLPRDAETRALLEALVRFRHAGNRTWNFEHGELHKRVVSCWLRKHRERAITITQPPPPITVQKGIRIASHVLAIAARLRDRKALTSQPEERLAQIFEPVWTEDRRPVTFSPKLGEVVRDLERRHGQMREFLVRELGAAQGRAEPKDFIDPQPIVDALKAVDESAELEVLPPSYQEGTARVRFVDVAGLGVYTDFAERLKAERAEIAARIDEVRRILRECQFEQEDLREALLAWLPPFLEVIELQRGGGGRRPILEMETPTFEAFWQQKVFRQRGESWGNALRAGNEIAGGTSAADLLEFNPATLDDAVNALRAAREHLEHLERYLSEQEQDLAAAGAGDCDVLLSELGAFPLDGTTAPEDDD
jgi:hypothetical protein